MKIHIKEEGGQRIAVQPTGLETKCSDLVELVSAAQTISKMGQG